MGRFIVFGATVALLGSLLAGCGAVAPKPQPLPPCQLVLEENPAYTATAQIAQPNPAGDVVFHITPAEGYTLTGADWPNYTLAPTQAGGQALTLHGVRYSSVVSLQLKQTGLAVLYQPNGGEGTPHTAHASPASLRCNTATGLFTRPGHTLLGWNTHADGSGQAVGLGSRIAWQPGLTLYAQWQPWAPEEDFTWTESGQGVAITGYTGSQPVVAVPASLGGKPVYAIEGGAFAQSRCHTLVLPQGLRRVEPKAFENAALATLYLFDDITEISDSAFAGCQSLATVQINAARPPVYSGSYYATFADKFDRLLALDGQPKLVLFSGSSTRFGYDSAALSRAFPHYEVANMGVFAYTNALPQLQLLLTAMQPGDILLHAPEFDAAQRQFCTTNALDEAFFALIEADYDLLARLDLRQFSQVFTAFGQYQKNRNGMTPRSYGISPAAFTEQGQPTAQPSYNKYGDYCLFRPNAVDDQPIFGLPVDYTVAALPFAQFVQPLNQALTPFVQKGIHTYITYAPRNRLALSVASTPAARAQLEDYLAQALCVPVISPLEESLYPGRYLFGTDNHLSTQGVALRTQRIIRDLAAQLAKEAQP